MQPEWLHLYVMASITLKNIPEHLHLAYKRRAKQHARSLQAEILYTLGQSADGAWEQPPVNIDDVAGCIKPAKRQVSPQEMNLAADVMFRNEWKRTR